MARVAVLGSTGMLGSTLTRILEQDFSSVIEFNRSGKSITGKNKAITLDALGNFNFMDKLGGLEIDYVINAIGMIKQVINEEKTEDIFLANAINNDFVIKLNKFSVDTGIRVIQIGTDCVYSGSGGLYSEEDGFDPIDVYGKTKNLGELASTESMLLRTSIIGKEVKSAVSLLGWVLSQPVGTVINGYINHIWNGVTTLHFSKIVSGIIRSESFVKGVTHLVPGNTVSKFELIKIIALEFGRSDLEIREFNAENPINRTLITVKPVQNLRMWKEGGYNKPPSIQEMVSQYAKWAQGN
jgi:dTDP-4-dehydrorhamnose reductase